jgi:WD40 repeat protein
VLRTCPRIVGIFQHGEGATWCEFSPDGGRIAAASKDATARVWDVATGNPITPPLQHEKAVRWAVFSPDGRRLLTASEDATSRVWDAATGAPVLPLLQHKAPVEYASFSPGGEWVLTIQRDAVTRVWNAFTGEPIRSFESRDESSRDGAFYWKKTGDMEPFFSSSFSNGNATPGFTECIWNSEGAAPFPNLREC